MCLAVVALDLHPRYALVIAANRDEYHARPTLPATWWNEGLLAGRDLEAGGTWLGVTREGRFALLTNVREPSPRDPDAPSRGLLVPRVLTDRSPPAEALASAREHGLRCNGFNLLAGTPREAAWASNRNGGVKLLSGGVHGLSNAALDVDWPKLARTKAAVARWAAAGEHDLEPLFNALADRTIAPDEALPSTGVTLEWERRLSAPFIVGDDYGTRSSTIVAIDRDGRAQFVERSFRAGGVPANEVVHRFELD